MLPLERIGQVTTRQWEQWTQLLSIVKLYGKQLQRNSIKIPEHQWLLVAIKEQMDDEMVFSTDHRAAGAIVLAFVPPPRGL